MADDLPTFDIQTPTGHVLTIQAPDQETALAGARQWHDDNSSLWGNIKGLATSIPHGFVQGLSDYGSKLATATAHEMSQPDLAAEIPDSKTTFDLVQENLTGELPVSPNTGGQIGSRAGQMLAYDPTG